MRIGEGVTLPGPPNRLRVGGPCGRKSVRGFCCPAPLGPLESTSVARCGPNRAFGQCNLVREDRVTLRLRMPRCRWHLWGFERFNGSFRPGKNTVFQYTSILVRPRHAPRYCGEYGGAAGYRPRVRSIYYTAQFIAIAGRTRHSRYRVPCLELKGLLKGWWDVLAMKPVHRGLVLISTAR